HTLAWPLSTRSACLAISGGAFDIADQPVALPLPPLTLGIVAGELLDELHGVVPDDLADSGSASRALLEQFDEVLEQGCRTDAVHRSQVHQVPLQRLDRSAIVLG